MLLQSNLIEREPSLEALYYAMKAWDFLTAQKAITHAVLTTMHGLLMESENLASPLASKWQGFYRTIPVYIGGRAGLVPFQIRSTLDQLFEKLNAPTKGRYSILPVSDEARAQYAKHLHVVYERVHPFVDGNGRTGRMLYNWHRLRLDLPVEVIGSDDESRRAYYGWFKEPETTKENYSDANTY